MIEARLEAMLRILRKLPSDIQVLGVFVMDEIATGSLTANLHLSSGITTLADFYGQEIRSEKTSANWTRYFINVDGVRVLTMKKTTKGQ